ncbi:cathepsin W [Erinaceus europaeus]|uniref:Cathepsin W n=1 Tax=Erinaceus europaeus TaxID=9365 RepID=A0A1S2ZG17_ERIEU|nr:cathepsin W [Erinaceus europaeus]
MSPTVPLSCLLALLVAVQGSWGPIRFQDPGVRPLELKEVFTQFQTQYNRSYSSPEEYARRLDTFARNLARAQRLQDMGIAQFGVTSFSDLTEEEFRRLHGHQWAATKPPVSRKVGDEDWGQLVPSSCDWRKMKGGLSPVRDQGNCRCCWAMAAAGNLEALWHIHGYSSVEVSVQELLDCSLCGDGCKGGYVWNAFATIINGSGLVSEDKYPFRGDFKPNRCQVNSNKKDRKPVAWIQDFAMLPENEDKIAGYLATHGPITVTINSVLLQLYKGGVLKATPATCNPQFLDHSVLLVGFGRDRGRRSTPYWILKNSWGTMWGEEGYFRLQRGNNACGITKFPITARVGQAKKKPPATCPP